MSRRKFSGMETSFGRFENFDAQRGKPSSPSRRDSKRF